MTFYQRHGILNEVIRNYLEKIASLLLIFEFLTQRTILYLGCPIGHHVAEACLEFVIPLPLLYDHNKCVCYLQLICFIS